MPSFKERELRNRDIRKLVVPKLHSVIWDKGTAESSEWIVAELSSSTLKEKLVSWLKSKNIDPNVCLVAADLSWYNVENTHWVNILNYPENWFAKHSLFVACDQSWVLEYAPNQVARFGRWQK